MTFIKRALTAAAVLTCCMGNEFPAKASMTTEQRAVCVRQLKNQLKNPSSLRRLGSPSRENASGIIKYSATNSFGGRVVGYYVCATGLNVTR